MVTDTHEQKLSTVPQLRAFLDGTEEVEFEPAWENDTERYGFIAEVVAPLRYQHLGRSEKGW